MNINDYRLHCCLPFLGIDTKEPVHIGPVAFIPGDQACKLLDPDVAGWLSKYLEGHRLTPQLVTCIAIDPNIDDKLVDAMIVDSTYLLYIASSYREIYDLLDAPDLHPFTKMIPADEFYIRKMCEEDLGALNSYRKKTILMVDQSKMDLCRAFGTVLTSAYDEESPQHDEMGRIMRSLRYFSDGFMRKFENIVISGLSDLPRVFNPELIILLMTAYDTLFNIQGKSSPSDLKQILRPMLKLKYSRSVELLWSWVDGLYKHFEGVIHGGEVEHVYTANNSLKLSYLRIGLKVFIYSFLRKMNDLKLIESTPEENDMCVGFDGISPREILILLWAQDDILRKISILMMQISEGNDTEEYRNDTFHLAGLYNLYLEKFIDHKSPHIHYIPSDEGELKNYSQAILNLAEELIEIDGKQEKLGKILPKEFLNHIGG